MIATSPQPSAPALSRGAARPIAGPRRLAVIDAEAGFLTALAAVAESAEWELLAGGLPSLPRLRRRRLEAIVFDPAPFGAPGWELLAQICDRFSDPGLLVCTARTSHAERVRWLRRGVDDWLTKPADPLEALARAEAISRRRRVGYESAREPLHVGGLELRPAQRRALTAGKEIPLSPVEFELLLMFARSEGEALERETIYRRVWGYAMARGDRSVDVFVRKLRAKLGQALPEWTYLHTRYRIGYVFEARPREAGS